jgi:spore germination protein KB
MFQNGKISPHQIKVLMALSYIGAYILRVPSTLAIEAKQDAWLSAVLGSVCGLLLIWFYTKFEALFGNLTIIQYCNKLFGKWLGGALSFLFVFCSFCNTLVFVWIVGDFITIQLMPETPLIVINLLFTITVAFACRLGLEATARAAEILFPWIIGGILSLFLFVIPDTKFDKLLPIFDSGIKPIIRATVLYNSVIPLTLVIFLMIFPSCVGDTKGGKKALLTGTIIGSIIIIAAVLFSILVLGAESTERNIYPVYSLAKKISIGHVLERLEAITAMVWIVALFFETFIYFYGTAIGLAQVFQLKDYKPLTLPLGMLIVIFSVVIFPNTTYAAEWDTTTYIPFSLMYALLFPMLLFLVGKLKHK